MFHVADLTQFPVMCVSNSGRLADNQAKAMGIHRSSAIYCGARCIGAGRCPWKTALQQNLVCLLGAAKLQKLKTMRRVMMVIGRQRFILSRKEEKWHYC